MAMSRPAKRRRPAPIWTSSEWTRRDPGCRGKSRDCPASSSSSYRFAIRPVLSSFSSFLDSGYFADLGARRTPFRASDCGDVSWLRERRKEVGEDCDGSKKLSGGRYRIRTYDFHRVKMALYR